MHTSSDILGHPKGLFICFATEMWERRRNAGKEVANFGRRACQAKPGGTEGKGLANKQKINII